jgi:hypothetical protein
MNEWQMFLKELNAPVVKTKDIKSFTTGATLTTPIAPQGAARQGAFYDVMGQLIAANEKKVQR